MPLHRYVTPTYFGGLPGTHDLINVISGGVGAGDGSSLVNPQKPGPHPNAGTYFVAFGEDATSGNANRGFKALAENTDFLDDIVHADQSLPVVSSAVVPGAPVGSVVITGSIFVGGSGETNDQRTRSGLVAVLDGDGIPLHILSGGVYLPVLVSKIHDGLGSSVIGGDYYTNPTVDFTPSIPTSQAYRLVYYARGNLKTQAANTYTRLADGIRGAEDLWAYAKTTKEGTATFTGVKTFAGDVFFGPAADVQFEQDVTLTSTASLIAQGPIDLQGNVTVGGTVTFNGATQFTVDALFDQDVDITGQLDVADDITTQLSFRGMGGGGSTVPILFTTSSGEDDSSEYRLLFSFKNNDTPGTFTRVYSKVTGSAYVVTINAEWDEGTTSWLGDVLTSPALKLSSDLTDALNWQSRDANLPGGGWLDSAWTGTVRAGSDLDALLVGATLDVGFDDATVPLLSTTSVASDNPGEATNAWKLLFSFATGGAAGDLTIRFYSGNFATLTGVFALTINAEYNGISGAGGLWAADDTGFSAYRISWDGTRSHVVHKEVTTVDWDDSSWDLVGDATLGAFAISGEYGYSGTKTRQKTLPLVGLVYGAATWDKILNSTGLQSSAANANIRIPVDLPNGATIIELIMLCDPAAASTVTAQLIRHQGLDFDAGSPSAGSAAVVETLTSSGAALQAVGSGAISYTIDRSAQSWEIRVVSGGVADLLYGLSVVYYDPGHRG